MNDMVKVLEEQVAALDICYSGCWQGLATHIGPCVVLEDGSMALIRDGSGYKLGRVQDAKRFVQDVEGAEAVARQWNDLADVQTNPSLRVRVVPYGDAVRRAYESARDLLTEMRKRVAA